MATNNSSKNLLMIFADSDAEANRARVFELFCQIAIAHSVELGWNHFCLDDIKIYEDGSIMFARKPVCNLSDALRRANYKDFAGLVLCLATGRHRAGRNLIRAGRKVKDPVLREIILTLGGQDEPGLEKIVEKLSAPYSSEADFFDGIVTIDEREIIEKEEKRKRAAEKKARERASRLASKQSRRQKAAASRRTNPFFSRLSSYSDEKWASIIIFVLITVSFCAKSCHRAEKSIQEVNRRAIRAVKPTSISLQIEPTDLTPGFPTVFAPAD